MFAAILVIVILLICAAAFSSLTIVPSVVGSAKEDAASVLEKKGFHVVFFCVLNWC